MGRWQWSECRACVMRAHAPSAPSLRLLMPAVGHRYTSRAMSLTFARIAMASRRCVEARAALYLLARTPRDVQRRGAQLDDKVAHARDGLKDRSGRHCCARAHRDRVGTSCRRYLRREEQAARASRGAKREVGGSPSQVGNVGVEAFRPPSFGCFRESIAENPSRKSEKRVGLLLDKRKPWSMLGCVVCYLSPSLEGWGLT